MQVIALFAAIVVILNMIAIGICTIVESYSEFAGLLTFLALFVTNFAIAWKTALYFTERYLLTDAQREANEAHLAMVRGR